MEKLTAHNREGKLEVARIPRLLLKHLKLIGIITVAVSLTAAVCLILKSNYYISKGTLLPTGDQKSSMLGSLAAAVPGLDMLNRDSEPTASSQLFPDILKSRLIREEVLNTHLPGELSSRFNATSIGTVFGTDSPTQMNTLTGITEIGKDKNTGIVSIAVEYTDPQLARFIALTYIERLEEYCSSERFARLNQNRDFIAGRLEETRERLDQAEDSLLQFREQNLNYYNSSAPDLQLEHERLIREVERIGKVYAVLSEQLELATLESERKKPVVAVLDQPALPLVKAGPARVRTTLQFGFGAFLLTCFVIVMIDYIKRQLPSSEVEEINRWQDNVEDQISGLRQRLKLIRRETTT